MTQQYKERLRTLLKTLTEQESQAKVAAKLGTTQMRVSRLLVKGSGFKIDDAIGFSRIFDLSLESVLFGGQETLEEAKVKEAVMRHPRKFLRSLSEPERERLLVEMFSLFDAE